MKKQFFTVHQLPISDGSKRVVFENHHVKLYDGENLLKECSCRFGDKIEYDKDTFFIIKGPKEKWKKILWDVGLTKGNWRNPDSVDKDKVWHSFTINDCRGDNYFITVWIMKDGFAFWYTKCKSIPENILVSLAKDAVSNYNLFRSIK